ncbi:MAG TPA: TrmB family transcriptional regulator sugar-binding domain-containing protein [Chitinophagales bacterium]|nr:TrmB family transcriptional regulator sugar-binding domain-containing protein [Chitinophagales bacterium]
MKNRITPKQSTIVRDYSQKIIENCWISTQSNASVLPTPPADFIVEDFKNAIIALIDKAQKTLMIYSPQLSDPDIQKSISGACARGVRVYLYTKDQSENEKALPLFAEKSIVRIGNEVYGSLVLTDIEGETAGMIYTGELSTQSLSKRIQNVALVLDENQIKEMYVFFCKVFWSDALFQYKFSTNKERVTEAVYGDIDVDRHLDIDEIESFIIQKNEGSSGKILMTMKNIRQSNLLNLSKHGANLILQTALLGNDPEEVKRYAKNQILLLASENALPFGCIVLKEEMYLYPNTDFGINMLSYLVRLNKSQSFYIRAYLKYIQEKCSIFTTAIPYQDVKTSFRLYNKAEEVLKMEEEAYRMQVTNNVPLSELNTPQWEEYLTEETVYAKKVHYKLELVPFYVPSGVKSDELYDKWAKLKKKLTDKLNEIDNKIDEIKSRGNNSPFEKLISFFSTKKNTFDRLSKEVEDLRKVDVTKLSKFAGRELFEKVNKLIQEVNGQDIAVKKETDRTVQEQKYEQLKKQKRQEKDEKEFLLLELEEKKEKLEEQKKIDLEAAIKNRNTQRGNFLQKIELERDWDELKLELEGQVRDGNTHHKRNKDKKNKHHSDINSDTKKRWEVMCKIDSEYEEIGVRFQKRLTEMEGQIEKLEQTISDLESEINQPFSPDLSKYEQQESSLKSMMRNSSYTSQSIGLSQLLPQQFDDLEEYPKVGELFFDSQTKKRYLVINYWEEFEGAKEEAKRLKAEICATK